MLNIKPASASPAKRFAACAFVTGHDFSRAENAIKWAWALQAAEKLDFSKKCEKWIASGCPRNDPKAQDDGFLSTISTAI